MVKGIKILEKLGKENFCKWLRKNGHKFCIDLKNADLRFTNLRGVNLHRADLCFANLRGADLRWANIDFSCLPLWCGSVDIIIDEKQAKQIMAHAINLALKYWPGGITEEQKAWLNDFHKIKAYVFPKFE